MPHGMLRRRSGARPLEHPSPPRAVAQCDVAGPHRLLPADGVTVASGAHTRPPVRGNHRRVASSISLLDVHVKESSVEVWMGSKGGMLKALIGLREIAKPHFSGIIEDPQCPNHS
jgi:hypothetical protein